MQTRSAQTKFGHELAAQNLANSKTLGDNDKLSILTQLDQFLWPQELKLIKPRNWDDTDEAQRKKLILESIDEINLHIELRSCFRDFNKSHLSQADFDAWYDRQIMLAHYIPLQPRLKRKI